MKTYEELSGAEGKRIFFRAERYRSRDLFQRAMPNLTIDNSPYTLHDISMSGLAAFAPQNSEERYRKDERVSMSLNLGDTRLFEASGEVTRIEPTHSGSKLGIRLLDRSFNVSEVVDRYKEITLRTDLAGFATKAPGAGVSAEYRTLCADTLHLLRSYHAGLDRISQTNLSSEAAADLLASCEKQIMPQWRELWHRGNALAEQVMADPDALMATKKFTELVLVPELMAGAIWKRSYEKPLGYPGDYQIMNMVYNWQREGSTLYEKLVHRIGLEVAECITTRMVMMRQEIAKTVLDSKNGAVKITTLGCGPAREIIDYLKLRELPNQVHLTLIDQDHGALGLAYEATHPEVIRLRKQATVTCLHASFSQLFKTKELFGTIGMQDFLYSVGLIDYLQTRRAKAWISSLYTFVSPGGKLIISNMYKTPGSNLWPMEFLCDWNIIYRDKEEMMALADGLPDATAEVSLDPTGRVCLLTVRRKA